MTTDTFERLRAIVLRDYPLDAAALVPDAPLEALGIDSLGLAELLFNVEEEFGIRLPSEPARLPTLADVVGYIDGLIAQQHGGGGQPSASAGPPPADAATPAASLAPPAAVGEPRPPEPAVPPAEGAGVPPGDAARAER